ncbi:flagellar hook-basal body complex protein FliE [Vibrio sp.]|uniref:flagellar hook-basal body complex protein FliE n=1 Tax=Vibrio sp. TaxID=678 RepID=UPI0037905EF1
MSMQYSAMQQNMISTMGSMRERAQIGAEVHANYHTVQKDNFQTAMQNAVRRVDNHQQHADQLTADVDAGRSDDLVGAMVASQKASISFQALSQVRNKVLSAYDDVLKMPL